MNILRKHQTTFNIFLNLKAFTIIISLIAISMKIIHITITHKINLDELNNAQDAHNKRIFLNFVKSNFLYKYKDNINNKGFNAKS
jgi:hypothetical protein